MLVEVYSGGREAFVPADPANYPQDCYEIAAADWRFLARFRGRWRRRWPADCLRCGGPAQDEYRFDAAGAAELRGLLADWQD